MLPITLSKMAEAVAVNISTASSMTKATNRLESLFHHAQSHCRPKTYCPRHRHKSWTRLWIIRQRPKVSNNNSLDLASSQSACLVVTSSGHAHCMQSPPLARGQRCAIHECIAHGRQDSMVETWHSCGNETPWPLACIFPNKTGVISWVGQDAQRRSYHY
jgi:hypothetical protein